MTDRILVTGGAGYIGSHTCVALAEAGIRYTILDNFSNANPGVIGRLESLVGFKPELIEGDVRDRELLDRLFEVGKFTGVIHFAGLKAVSESVDKPIEYYDNNFIGTVRLVEAMRTSACRTLVFSSSATVYGAASAAMPLREDSPLAATNPYGRSKLMVEDMLRDLGIADSEWRIALLRYFNPVGAHASGLIGEDPRGTPNNLMPYISQVAVGRLPRLNVFGDDYPTPDGTGVRDYIHVVDLAAGHLAALARLRQREGVLAVNLGTGKGTSVLEMIRAFEAASGRSIPYQVAARRPGDVAECWADPSHAYRELGWRARLALSDMCVDAWRWQSHQAG
ncbi:UDP-glucose 4-epimerase GalE [Pseudoxanthomonas kaohsiungensis]|uniref:UDP-glucose 4-epimerase n=1 Tax=Pseudoxanthomonas kaohsiungensis TaxID=283923 RepID=A0ABW3LU60_9GAMM|nr:UDP-glucose 4-epimerase GalE [Pseudoxanthomonas kaohsiungensis]KAF1704187.1 UDP-glucose 4-epimerase GalE [Pseudoxanthomonas kaohsiungensis]